MAGAGLVFTFNDGAVREAFGRLMALARDPYPILDKIGSQMVEVVRHRFDDARDPDGQPWHTLLPAYAAIKQGPGILRELGMQGGLQGSIVAERDGPELAVGSNKIYANVHQHGATIVAKNAPSLAFPLMGASGHVFLHKVQSVTVPARPYLGFNVDDGVMMVRVAEGYLEAALADGPDPFPNGP